MHYQLRKPNIPSMLYLTIPVNEMGNKMVVTMGIKRINEIVNEWETKW